MSNRLSFSPENIQFAWDSTSITSFKECPRKYYLSIVLGYRGEEEKIDLIFGLHYHAALEKFDHERANGKSYEEALRSSVRLALERTWINNKPWISLSQYKNRETLVRTIVLYLDQFKDDPLEVMILQNGKPATELSYRFPTEYSICGNRILLCGHLDRVVKDAARTMIMDRKTTKQTLSEYYFSGFNPNNQFTQYLFAGRVVFNFPVNTLIIDAAQVAIGFSRFQRVELYHTEEYLNEWYYGLSFLFREAEEYYKANFFPMRETACGNYGGCQYRSICSKTPSDRKVFLEKYTQNFWDPLQIR